MSYSLATTPIRNTMAKLSANIFEFCFEQLGQIGDTISSAVTGSDGGMLGNALGNTMGDLVKIEGTLDTTIGDVRRSLMGTGYALCMLFFIISLVELAMSERMQLETFVKFFSKFAVGVLCVYKCDMIYSYCRNIGHALSGFIADQEFDSVSLSEIDITSKFLTFVGQNGASSWLPLFLASILIGAPALLFAILMVAMAYFMVFSWVLEMGIRGVFLPVALGMMSHDGWNGAGGRYIRRFLAVCSQGAVMVLIGKLMSSIINQMIESALGVVNEVVIDSSTGSMEFALQYGSLAIITCMISFAALSMMSKSVNFVNDAFGG